MVTVVICDSNGDRADELSTLIKTYLESLENAPKDINIVTKSQSRIMLVPTAVGEELVYIKDLNYVNIEDRSLCYHMHNNILKASHVLRTSFEKSVSQYLHHPNLLFIKPSLLINVSNIKCLDREKIIFRNNETLYYPKKHYDVIKDKWLK